MDIKTQTRKITKEINECIKSKTTILRENNETLVYVLPLDEKENYSRLFKNLEERKKDLGIVTMGISLTTLDDVFMK